MSEQDALFSNEILEVLTPIWANDKVAIRILLRLFLEKEGQEEGPVTIAKLATEIKGTRREAVRDKKGKIIGYDMKDGIPIGRPRAEKIVDKLIHASLVEVVELPPAKVLKVTRRGEQLLASITPYLEDTN